MKRLLVALAVIGLVALPLSDVTGAAKKKVKKKGDHTMVEICHVNSANGIIVDASQELVRTGKIIQVDENALAAHEAHDDSTEFEPLTEADYAVAEAQGVLLRNADCKIKITE